MTVAAELRELEESLWREATRFDRAYMDGVLAADFIEFGRSGRIFSRADSINVTAQPIGATVPLRDFAVRQVAGDAYLVTYTSEVTFGDEIEYANRSSLWVRTPDGYKLCFHQGTPRGALVPG